MRNLFSRIASALLLLPMLLLATESANAGFERDWKDCLYKDAIYTSYFDRGNRNDYLDANMHTTTGYIGLYGFRHQVRAKSYHVRNANYGSAIRTPVRYKLWDKWYHNGHNTTSTLWINGSRFEPKVNRRSGQSCMAGCGPGCSATGGALDIFTGRQIGAMDCMDHDMCGNVFNASDGNRDSNCGDSFNHAADTGYREFYATVTNIDEINLLSCQNRWR